MVTLFKLLVVLVLTAHCFTFNVAKLSGIRSKIARSPGPSPVSFDSQHEAKPYSSTSLNAAPVAITASGGLMSPITAASIRAIRARYSASTRRAALSALTVC